ncbi:methylenetetrahydrofolate reductase [Deinococcus gobiensis]|uniref:5,10-methylenetetrahydrofolate reductase-related protein n=1 Tax=Deinococcus gobiensis (strain DSM 21396 / JCM 16679 / CGMCC 1.7299 / I-0) TaxID=745776 RepID=H8GYK7_DEIGI|nr:methylenetetrahydrofolate reductase [Deinococcus gobiensis]AFD26054.1 5,10-methylenetetrahydrofolate reductase-related protein [Deinococcus gobiensis I-0]
MTRISLELVPRSRSGLRAELDTVREHFPGVDTVNVPDLTRFSTRSWEGCAFARPHLRAIPHIRAIDLNPKEPLPMSGLLLAHEIDEVLIVTGDAPSDMNRRVYNVDAEAAIRRFRRELPHVRVYAGLDPYRQSFARERDYLERKLEAGAVGFFSQPFFDLRLMDTYADLLPEGAEMWWGVTNVTTEGSANYWASRNNAVFPRSFDLSLEWNRKLAGDALHFARDRGQHVYFQPIRTDLREYLEGIL